MTSPHWDILGIGNAAVDELILLDSFPAPDSKMPVRGFQRQGGGLTATALVAAARLGANAAFCSLVGFDELSEFTLADLAAEGVDTAPCVRDEQGVPYHAFILVERAGQTRTILYQPGVVEPPVEAVTPGLISSTRVLFFDHHAPMSGAKAARLARERGIPVVADIESERVPNLDELLELPDHLILGLAFSRRVTGLAEPEEIARALFRPGRACAAVTAGARGCWFCLDGDVVQHQPAYPVEVVDTTGCGDVFHGAYAAALARGEEIPSAVRLASAAAALKATRAGGRAGIPSRAALEEFIKGWQRTG